MAQQPLTLESLVISKLVNLITLHVQQNINLTSNPDDDAAKNTEDLLPREIRIIRDNIESMPRTLQNKLLKELLDEIVDMLEDNNREVVERMLEMFFNKNVSSLTLNERTMIELGDYISSKSNKLSGLKVLECTFPLYYWDYRDVTYEEELKYCDEENYHMEYYIIQFLEGLRNLEYLSISCTDNILRCIAENCKLIEVIDLYNYFNVTIKSIVIILVKLRNLKTINLYEPIANDTHSSNTHKLMEERKRQHLDFLFSLREELNLEVNIKSYVNYGETTCEDLQDVINKYPIQNMSFYQDEDYQTLQKYIDDPIDLKNLRELKIIRYEFYTGNVKEFLQLVGSKLEKLSLEYVDEADSDSENLVKLACPHVDEVDWDTS